MDEDLADRLAQANRVSIGAVLVPEGADPNPILNAAGIYDAVVIPFIVDGEASADGGLLGDGVTPNVVATFDFGGSQPQAAASEPPADATGSSGAVGQPRQDQVGATSSLPEAYGIKPMAPVRRLPPSVL